MKLEAEWRKDKLEYYSKLIDSITETMSMPRDFNRVYKQLAHDYNKVILVAPQNVAEIAFKFYRIMQKSWDQEETFEDKDEDMLVVGQKQRLQQLVLAMRKDLQIETKDDPGNFYPKLRSPLIED